MKIEPKLILPAVLGAFVVLVVFLFWEKGQGVATLPSASLAANTAPSPGDASLEDAPSKDNVNHTFVAEENRLRLAIEKAPTDTTSILRLARFYHDAHKLPEAIETYDKYLVLHPDNRQAWADVADCYAGLSDMEGAKKSMEKALEQFPDNPMMLYNLGAIQANMGQFEDARKHWSRVRDIGTDDTVTAMAIAGLDKIK